MTLDKRTSPFRSTLIALLALTAGCDKFGHLNLDGYGGGRDAVTIDLPFAADYTTQCVQGAGGDYSHQYNSTWFDVDLDTPNDTDDIVYAPTTGTAYVHDANPDGGFGIHVNIDMGDGTYVIIAHLDDVFIESGEEVTTGQVLGFEGMTGYATGDHVHLGRHAGDAHADGTLGESLEGLELDVTDTATGERSSLSTTDLLCDLYDGRTYASELETPMWHPSGTLIKTPSSSTVYLLEDGTRRAFTTQDVFWSYNYSFEDVAIVSDAELNCYSVGSDVDEASAVQALYSDGEVWLLLGDQSDSSRERFKVRSTGWQAVLKSWGIVASTYDDLLTDDDLLSDYPSSTSYATFRNGALLTETSSSAVYVISDSVAMPIQTWDTYLLLDYFTRDIITVDDGVVYDVQGRVGDCSTDAYCVSTNDVITCGGAGESVEDLEGDDEPGPSVEDEEEEEASEDDPEEEAQEEPEDSEDETAEEPAESDDLPDDLGEGLDWIRVDGDELGLKIDEVFTDSVDGEEVVATGEGLGTGWSYDTSHLVDYDDDTDMGWYGFGDGSYRVTMRTTDEWAMYHTFCASSSQTSELCHQNSDGSYALCFTVFDDELAPMSTSACQALE